MVRVRKSTVVNAPIDHVWDILRDFNGHDRWHPAIGQSRIEDALPSDVVGCVRDFTLASGGRIREQLLSLSDKTYSFTYCLLEAPVPLVNYVSTVRLKPVTDGNGTFWEWICSFDPPAGRAEELSRLVGEEIYEAGFRAIRDSLAGKRKRSSQSAPTSSTVSAPAISSGQSMRGGAMVLTGHGGPERMEWREQNVPAPGPGQVRLRHNAIGVNYIDVYCRTGYYKLVEPPGIIGMEAAGSILDVGAGVHGFAPGDRVAYACPPPGAYCELRTMSADLLALLPDEIDDATAAAAMLKGVTAEFLLHRVHHVKEGDSVLIHAAAGGVGLYLCQWARRLGATVIGTVGSEEKAQLARRYGCSYPVIYTQQDFLETVRDVTEGRGVDVVYDGIGASTFEKSYEALALRGHLVSYGQASGSVPAIDISSYSSKSVSVSRPNYAHYTSTAEEIRSSTDRLFPLLINGDLKVEIGQRFPLRQAGEAHKALEARQTTGSTILTLGE
ncbi:zinc-binding dehydrogenase [Fodinicurvata fenggangensis]|uniref:zinc-binding dehydrogenase n=1 Tax=Fodinicurvata fenggangensis TaxID=1121830 RepID=UPI0009DE57F4|nr:zinc-binding dehydrogenase [Fodinicurvata fenggangensis]